LLAATYWVRSGRVQVAGAAWSETFLVYTRRSQSLAKVPRFRAGVHADCMLWAVHGPTYSVSDFWWGLGPTAWNSVGSTLHLQQADCQSAALQMVPRASGFSLWSLCQVPHTSLFSSCIRLHDHDYCFGKTNDSKYNGSLSLRQGWVLSKRTCAFIGIQFTRHFIEFVVVETKQKQNSHVDLRSHETVMFCFVLLCRVIHT